VPQPILISNPKLACMLETPLMVVNFKTYAEVAGGRAVELARVIAELARGTGVNVAVAPQHVDLYQVASQVDIPVLAQHVDPISSGTHTGWLLPDAAKEAGAVGALVNHSEHPMTLQDIAQVVRRLKELGMVSITCASDPDLIKSVAALGPDMVAVEPPELIGTGQAVSRVKPEVVSGAVEAARSVNPSVHVLCGAGIASGEDARLSLELGAEGVLIASRIVRPREGDPRAITVEILEGMRRAKAPK